MNAGQPESLTVVVPIYNEEAVLPELGRRLREACDGIEGLEWRVLYVNDGSSDASMERIRAQRAEDERFTALSLSRNFGHQGAITAGLAHVCSDAVVVIDGDLQDPPEVIPELVKTWREGAQVVFATRSKRQERGLRRFGVMCFHRFFRWISDYPIQSGTGVFSLLDREALEELNRLGETHRFLPGLESWIGFDQRRITYQRTSRAAGQPKQSLSRLVRYAFDAIFGFSYKPLRLLTLGGVTISLLGFLLALVFILRRLLGVETAETGFTTLVTLILVLGGVQLCAIGVLGEYLGRVYDEAKSRPLFIVRERLGVEEPAGPDDSDAT